jgi:subtilisin family serine protease
MPGFKFFGFFAFFSLFLGFSGPSRLLAEEVRNPALPDDQTLLNQAEYALANPMWKTSSPQEQSARHRVVMAVIDTGTDYNHPLLAENIHFVPGDGPGGARPGYDFVAEDPFPAPYIVHASRQERTPWERANFTRERTVARLLVEALPHLERFVHPGRQLLAEQAHGAYHGTHVGALMTYDRPDFGLLAYRVFPYTDPEVIRRNIPRAIRQAVKDGARIVNLSLGALVSRDPYARHDPRSPESRENHERNRAYTAHIAKVFASFPDVLFVVSAGNDGQWIDHGVKQFRMCVKVPNVLCVGALDERGQVTEFSNVMLDEGVNLVYALGAGVLSAIPRGMCASDTLENLLLLKPGAFEGKELKETLSREVRGDLRRDCVRYPGMAPLSGTSMSAPLVSHVAGELLARQPRLTPPGLIREILERATPSKLGRFPIHKLRVKKPSWYPEAP